MKEFKDKYNFEEKTVYGKHSQNYYYYSYKNSYQETFFKIFFSFALIGTLMMFFLEFFINMPAIMQYLKLLTLPFFIIFATHLIIEYSKSPNFKHFIYHHGIDAFLLGFIGLYIIIGFIAIISIPIYYVFPNMPKVKELVHEAKNLRIIIHEVIMTKLFKKN